MTPLLSGHSQFEKIPISQERQERLLQEQIDEIEAGVEKLRASHAERFTIKQLERMKKQLETKLQKLTSATRKDDVVTFEQLGVDRLYVDEAHNYKNLFLYTKMRNVAGLSTTDAQKSSDMYLKCRYMDELTGGRGIVFATGTPVSNSMTELYTMMRYLQHDLLASRGFSHFDCWASTFGETVTAIELAPGGDGLPRTHALCQVLQPTGADGHVQGGGGHQDRRPAAPAHPGGGVSQRGGQAYGNAEGYG